MGNSATREKISTQQRHERDDRNVGGTEASTPPIPESWVQNDSNSLYFVTPTDVRLEFGGKNLEFEIVGSTGDPVGQQIRDGRGLKSDSSRFTENSTGVGETFKRPTNQCETPTLQSGTTRGHLVTTESDCIRSPLSSFTAGRHDCWSNGWEKTGNFTGRDCRYSYGSDVRYRVDIINRTKDWPNPYSRKELLTAPRQNAAVFTHLDIGGINDCNLSQSHLADNKVATQSLPNLSFTHTSFNPPLSLKFVALRRKSMELHSAGPFRSNEESIKRSKLTLPLTSPMANDSGFVYTTLRAKTPQQTSNSGKFTPFSQEACVAKGDNNSFSVEKGQRRRQPLLYRNPSLPKSTIKPSCEPNNNERFEEKDIFTGQELIDWIASEVLTDKHYLRRLVTKQDFQLLITELCSRLIVLGVVTCTQQFSGIRFKPEFSYYWSGGKRVNKTDKPDKNQTGPGGFEKTKVGRSLTFLDKSNSQSPINEYLTTLKYTEQDFQAVLMGIKREHKEALDDLNEEHQSELQMLNDKKLSVIRGYEARIKQLRKRLELYEPSGRFESNSSESESTELATGQMCYRCQQQRLFQLKSVECQTESKPQSFTTASSQTEPKPMWQSREIQTDFDPLIIASPSGLDGIIPHGHNDDSNSDCRSSISVDSAFCDDQMLPATSDTQIAPAPPAPPPPPMPLTLGRKVGFQLPTTDASRCRKPVLKPKVPMKPLYWKRIQLPNTTRIASKNLWTQLEEVEIDEDEICDLFARVTPPNMQNLMSSKRMSICAKRETMKVLDDKRSEALGILIQSKHLDLSEIACALFNCDTSLVSIEVLQRLYQQRPQLDELQAIKAHLDSGSVIPLDRQEQFLWELSQIPQLEERIEAIILQATFPEKFYDIEQRLNTMLTTCKSLRHNKSLHWILSLILHVGNYLNGQSSERGQADGFGLDILPKLKDLKGKDNSTTVLNYVCRAYLKKFHGDSLKANTPPPLAESSDFRDVAGLNFVDVEISFDQLSKEIDLCGRKVALVLEQSDEVHKSPFREIMAEGLKKAETTLDNLRRLLVKCKSEFDSVTSFFHWTQPQLSPNGPNNNTFAAKEFFSIWAVFASDFKHAWKREKEKMLRNLSAIESHRKAATLPHLSNSKRSRSVSSYLSQSATLNKKTMSKDSFMSAINKIMTDSDALHE